MRLITLSLCLLLYCTAVKAQVWTKEEYEIANTAGDADYLSAEEKAVVLYMNLSRLNGKKFFDTYLMDYIDRYNQSVKKYRNYNQLKVVPTNPYYQSLKKTMYGIKDLNLFYPDEVLTSTSKKHALDLWLSNTDNHTSSNGETLTKRINKIYPNLAFSENIDFGFSKGLDIVCHLLFDFGVPNLGHRKNILDEQFEFDIVGIAIQKHKRYNYCAVINFVALMEDTEEDQ